MGSPFVTLQFTSALDWRAVKGSGARRMPEATCNGLGILSGKVRIDLVKSPTLLRRT
jgi:hypothetical protein